MQSISIKKIIASILILSLVISGCSRNLVKYSNEHEFEFYSRINKLCENKNDLTLEMIDGQKYRVKELIMSADTTNFIDIESNMTIIKSTKDISSITFTQMGKGTLVGLLIGGVIGLVTLFLGEGGGTAAPKGNIYPLIYFAVSGAVIGSVYGLISPSKTIIKIN